MRDTRKTEAYFEAYIAYEQERIEHWCEKLADAGNTDKKLRVNANLLLNRMHLMIASFSYGASRSELQELYKKVCATACETRALTYYNALVLASFSVMLNETAAIQPLFKKFGDVFDDDKLLNGLRSYIQTGKAVWTGDYRFPTPYSGLDAVLAAPDKAQQEQHLMHYLEGWYAGCEDCVWYDTLYNENDVYYGYWSFESAAIADILGLDPKYLAECEYFPAL